MTTQDAASPTIFEAEALEALAALCAELRIARAATDPTLARIAIDRALLRAHEIAVAASSAEVLGAGFRYAHRPPATS